MQAALDFHLQFEPPSTDADSIEWLLVCDKHAKQLLAAVSNPSFKPSTALLDKLHTILSSPLTRSAALTYGQVLYLARRRTPTTIPLPSSLLVPVFRARCNDKKSLLSSADIDVLLDFPTSDMLEVLPSFVECLSRTLHKTPPQTLPVEQLFSHVSSCIRLTRAQKHFTALKDAYALLLPIVSEHVVQHELAMLPSLSWNTKLKFALLLPHLVRNASLTLTTVPDTVERCFAALSSLTFRSLALHIIVHLFTTNILPTNDLLPHLAEDTQTSLLLVSLFQSSPLLIEQCKRHVPLATLAALRALPSSLPSPFSPETITAIITDTIPRTRSPAHLLLPPTLLSPHQKPPPTPHLLASYLSSLTDAPNEELQAASTMLPKLLLKLPPQTTHSLLPSVLSLASPFNDAADSFVLQTLATLLPSLPVDSPVLLSLTQSQPTLDLVHRALHSPVEKTASLAASVAARLLPGSMDLLARLRRSVLDAPRSLFAVKTAEATTAASLLALVAPYAPHPIVEHGAVVFSGASLDTFVASLRTHLTHAVEAVRRSTEHFAEESLHGCLRVVQLLHVEHAVADVALALLDASAPLVTLATPEGVFPAMVVSGWTSVRAATEVVAAGCSFDDAAPRLEFVLRNALHRGIFERSAAVFERLLVHAPTPWLAAQVAHVLSSLSDEHKTTRRSAGLPFHLVALLHEELRRVRATVGAPPLLRAAMTALLAAPRATAIHALNIMTGLLRSQRLAELIDVFFPGAPLLAALRSADDADWSVRNAASILLATTIKRLFARTDDFTLEQLAAELPEAVSAFPELLSAGGRATPVVCMLLARLSFVTRCSAPCPAASSLSTALLDVLRTTLDIPTITSASTALTRCWRDTFPNPLLLASPQWLAIFVAFDVAGCPPDATTIARIVSHSPQSSFELYHQLHFPAFRSIAPHTLLSHLGSDEFSQRCRCVLLESSMSTSTDILSALATSDRPTVSAALRKCISSPSLVEALPFTTAILPHLSGPPEDILLALDALSSILLTTPLVTPPPSLITTLHSLLNTEPLLQSSCRRLLLLLNVPLSFTDLLESDLQTLTTFFTTNSLPPTAFLVSLRLLNIPDDRSFSIAPLVASALHTDADRLHLLHALIDHCLHDSSLTPRAVLDAIFPLSSLRDLFRLPDPTTLFEPEPLAFLTNPIDLLATVVSQSPNNDGVLSYLSELQQNLPSKSSLHSPKLEQLHDLFMALLQK